MQSPATFGLLFDTLDSLVAMKLDLASGERHGKVVPAAQRERMSADIDHSIDNIRAIIAGLTVQRERPVVSGK